MLLKLMMESLMSRMMMMTRWFGGGGWAIYNTLVGISWGISWVFLVVFLGVFLEDDDDDSVVWWQGVGNLQPFSRGRRGLEADIRGGGFLLSQHMAWKFMDMVI